MCTGGQLHLELLDERSNVLVRDDGTLILLDAEDGLVDMNLEVALHLALATQSPALLDFLAGEVRLLGIEDFAPTLQYLYFTLSARCLATAG